MANKKLVHYNMDEIDSKNANFNIIYGERSNGKSYQVKHKKAVKKYLETGKRFILIRRYKEEITTDKIESYFSDVDIVKLTDGKYNCIILYRKQLFLALYDLELNKTTKGEKIGYVVALSTEQNYAGGSYLDVEDIIFEEFMSRSEYLHNEPDKLMNFYCTVDRKRGTTKLWLVGNSISRVCPYIPQWGLHSLIHNQKQGTILVKEIESDDNEILHIAVEYCRPTGVSSHVIGKHKKMLNNGDWQTDPQPHLRKSRKEYKKLFDFYFKYQDFCFVCERLIDEELNQTCWFIYPYTGILKKNKFVITDEVRESKYYQRNIYDLSINNDKIKKVFDTFRENKIFYCNDLCGTDFKQVIDFTIKK